MKSMPRILPLVGVAMGGVLAVNALAGARGLPELLSGAKAFAEETAKGGKAEAAKPEAKAAAAQGKDAAAQAAARGAACAPTAAELARQAGLSPAELQVLQSLGARRGELDQRETALDTQIALLAAAEAKLDAKMRALNGLKGEVQGLLVQADNKEAAEIDRLVKVFEGMKAKDAAPRMVLLDDSVRIPVAAKMKERALSAILAAMPPAEAKKLTEALAKRFTDAKAAAMRAAAAAAEPQPGAAPAAQQAAAPPAQPARKAAAPAAPPAAPQAKAG
ncbi:MotE family protein [Phenylobacterium sp.]|uniref:MotE family protein n=1 Tax=Phenylobacterium sp. TaxID=1871053 RepID=UPI0035B3F40E